MNRKNKFSANRNMGIMLLLWAALICCLALIIYMVRENGSVQVALTCVFCAVVIVVAFFLLRAFYVFKEDHILSVFGPYRDRFYFSDITKIKLAPPQRGMLQGVRLVFYYGDVVKGYICPRDLKAFIDTVKKYIPHAEIEI